eukprot:754856-Hanusia_phi.AAC.2
MQQYYVRPVPSGQQMQGTMMMQSPQKTYIYQQQFPEMRTFSQPTAMSFNQNPMNQFLYRSSMDTQELPNNYYAMQAGSRVQQQPSRSTQYSGYTRLQSPQTMNQYPTAQVGMMPQGGSVPVNRPMAQSSPRQGPRNASVPYPSMTQSPVGQKPNTGARGFRTVQVPNMSKLPPQQSINDANFQGSINVGQQMQNNWRPQEGKEMEIAKLRSELDQALGRERQLLSLVEELRDQLNQLKTSFTVRPKPEANQVQPAVPTIKEELVSQRSTSPAPISKGQCGNCIHQVWSDEERVRSEDGVYYHKQCYERAMADKAKAPNNQMDDFNKSSLLASNHQISLTSQSPLFDDTLKNTAPHTVKLIKNSEGYKPIIVDKKPMNSVPTIRTSRGKCGSCKLEVYNDEERCSHEGVYYHKTCFEITHGQAITEENFSSDAVQM